jgi:hypothetical protein
MLLVYQLRPDLLTPLVWVALQEEMCMQSVQKLASFHTVLVYAMLYTIICTHTEPSNDISSAYDKNP